MKRDGSTCDVPTLLFDVWLVANLTRRLLDDALRDLDVTADEYAMSSLLHGAGALTPTRISRLTGMAPTTVSGTVRRMTARGHVESVANPDDARSRLLGLTAEGVRVTQAGAAVLDTTLGRLLDVLDRRGGTARAGLDDLDHGLRQLVGAEPRTAMPAAARTDDTTRTVSYSGPPLSAAQSREARAFIDWLRVRDARA